MAKTVSVKPYRMGALIAVVVADEWHKGLQKTYDKIKDKITVQ